MKGSKGGNKRINNKQKTKQNSESVTFTIDQKKRFLINNEKRKEKGQKPKPMPPKMKALPRVEIDYKPMGKPGQKGGPEVRDAVKQEIQRLYKQHKTTAILCESATNPSSTAIPWDKGGFYVMLEALAAHYAMATDLFSQVSPQVFAYYLGYLTLQFLSTNGSIVGSLISSSAAKSTSAVPYAFAKFLEYIAPYKGVDKVQASMQWQYVPLADGSTLFGPVAPENVGIGNATGDPLLLNSLYPRPDGAFPSWLLLPMKNNTALVIPNNTNTLAFPVSSTLSGIASQTFTTFLTQPNVITAVSNLLSKRGNTINLKDVPTRAPDSSAFARLIGQAYPENPGDLVGGGGMYGVDSNYDPELVSMFSPFLTAGTFYPTSTRKNYINPLFTPQEINWPDYFSIASVWVFVAQSFTGKYRAGRFRSVFTFNKRELLSLYPDNQPISGAPLSELIQSSHDQTVINKQTLNGSSIDYDSVNYNLTLEATVAYSAFQRRLNLVEVMHCQCPAAFQQSTIPILVPQMMYVDKNFNINLDLAVAAAISAVGPVVLDGRLRIPWTPYRGIQYIPSNENTVIGPAALSAYGFVLDYTSGTEYKFSTALSNAWLLRGNDPIGYTPPLIIWDNTSGTGQVCDSGFVAGETGPQQLNVNLVPGIVYPIFPTCGAANCILYQYRAWKMSGTQSQIQPTAPVTTKKSGHFHTMTMTYNIDPDDISLSSANPNFSPASGNVLCMNVYPSDMALTGPANKSDVATSALLNQGLIYQKEENTSLVQQRYYSLKQALAAQTSTSALEDDTTIIGQHGVDLPWSTGKTGIVASIAEHISSTASPISKTLTIAQNAGGSFNTVGMFKQVLGPILDRSMDGASTRMMKPEEFSKGIIKHSGSGKGGAIDKLAGTAGKVVKFGEQAYGVGSKLAEML